MLYRPNTLPADKARQQQRSRAWATRAVLIGLLVLVLRPVPVRIALMPPQTVETTVPQMCVHTRLIDEVDEWKIQQSLILVREMGADTVVEFFPWAYIQNAPDRYDWTRVDRIVRHAQNQGLRVIARMGFVPGWARDDPHDRHTTLNTLPPQSYDEFAAFVAAFARRYAGTVDDFIIWNEPNLAFEWGYQAVDPAGYARLLQAVYAPAHAANPAVTILAAGLAPTLEPSGSPHGLNDLLYLDALYAAGAAPYFDALAVHTYGFTHPPEDAPAPDALNFRRAELLHEIMTRYGDSEKPVYITETGWNDHPRWTLAVSPAQRIAYTLGAFEWAAAHWSWANKLCLWMFRLPAATFSYPDYFTLVTTDFQVKPIYSVLQAYTRGESTDHDLWLPPPT
jgi:hypothetical protein